MNTFTLISQNGEKRLIVTKTPSFTELLRYDANILEDIKYIDSSCHDFFMEYAVTYQRAINFINRHSNKYIFHDFPEFLSSLSRKQSLFAVSHYLLLNK